MVRRYADRCMQFYVCNGVAAKRCMSMQLQQGQLCDLLSRLSVELGQPWKKWELCIRRCTLWISCSSKLHVPWRCLKHQGFLAMELVYHGLSDLNLVMSFQSVNWTHVCALPIASACARLCCKVVVRRQLPVSFAQFGLTSVYVFLISLHLNIR